MHFVVIGGQRVLRIAWGGVVRIRCFIAIGTGGAGVAAAAHLENGVRTGVKGR